MRLFLPFLVAGTILMALLYVQVLRPSLLEPAQDSARRPSLSLVPGVKAHAGARTLVHGDPLKDRPRTSLAEAVKKSMAVDQAATDTSQMSGASSTLDGGGRP